MTTSAVTLGLAVGVAYERMAEDWTAFPLFLLAAVPSVALFVLALLPNGGSQFQARDDAVSAGRWRSAALVVAHLLLFLSLVSLVRVLGDDNPGSATATWTLAVTAAGALIFSERFDSPGLRLLGLLLLGGAVLALVHWVDENTTSAGFRDVLLIEGGLFLLIARALRSRLEHSHVAVAAAALALIAGASVGIFEDVGIGLFLGVSEVGEVPGDNDGWELVLLLASVGALAYSGWQRYRGTVYPGLIGLGIFFAVADEGSLDGWPLILLVVSLVLLAWALYGGDVRRAPDRAESPPTAE
jgi:hypothetical protein